MEEKPKQFTKYIDRPKKSLTRWSTCTTGENMPNHCRQIENDKGHIVLV